MLQALRDHAQREGLYFGHGLVVVGTVAKHARQGRNFSKPAPVIFAFEFDRESHCIKIHPGRLPNKRWQPTAARAILNLQCAICDRLLAGRSSDVIEACGRVAPARLYYRYEDSSLAARPFVPRRRGLREADAEVSEPVVCRGPG